MGIKEALKLLPYGLILLLILIISFGKMYYSHKVDTLTDENKILETQNAEVNNNYNTLQNMYSISMKQTEELQKQQATSLNYVSEVEQTLIDVDLSNIYDTNAQKLLDNINEYEKCMAKNFKKPSVKCNLEFK